MKRMPTEYTEGHGRKKGSRPSVLKGRFSRRGAKLLARQCRNQSRSWRNPSLMAKLPLPFKQMGMSIHKDMDALADAIVQKETPQQILQRLSSMTVRCTTCHDLYRFSTGRET